jgi:hypothetical protein
MPNNSGVKFENDWQPPLYEQRAPKIIRWVMKWSGGLVQNEKQASYVLIGFFILAAIIFLMIILNGGSERPSGPPTPFQVQEGKF